jgi:hydrogenase expression/formation protein HypE
MSNDLILIGHGSGGRLTHKLIRDIFLKEFGNTILDIEGDAALLSDLTGKLAFTTDSFVIDPIFFPGGDIGKLAVCGTINDLCVVGSTPKYLSLGVIIEEGFPIASLKKIAHSIASEAKKAGVLIAAGDTKVVKRGQCDKIFINTTGIGVVPEEHCHLADTSKITPGDAIIVTGTLGDHSIAILASRENLKLDENIQSDVASLDPITKIALKNPADIVFMRDITRGGLATVLNEICSDQKFGIEISKDKIPVRMAVESICELYGFDPMYLANEGKIVMIIRPHAAEKLMNELKKTELAKNAAVIGSITSEHPAKVVMNSTIGGKRLLNMLNGEMLPRIC